MPPFVFQPLEVRKAVEIGWHKTEIMNRAVTVLNRAGLYSIDGVFPAFFRAVSARYSGVVTPFHESGF